MKELSHFLLGVSYILSLIAARDFSKFRLDINTITGDQLLMSLFVAISIMFIYISIGWITIYFLTLVHDLLRKAED